MRILLLIFIFTVAVGRVSLYRKRKTEETPKQTVTEFVAMIDSADLISLFSEQNAARKIRLQEGFR